MGTKAPYPHPTPPKGPYDMIVVAERSRASASITHPWPGVVSKNITPKKNNVLNLR